MFGYGVGAASAVGAFLAFGLGPMAAAPAAQAEFDFFGLDLDWLSWDTAWWDAGSAAFTLPDGSPDSWVEFDTQLYDMLYTPIQSFLDDPASAGLLNLINMPFAGLGGACGLICNGADAHLDDNGDLVAAQNGGWLYGNGGAASVVPTVGLPGCSAMVVPEARAPMTTSPVASGAPVAG